MPQTPASKRKVHQSPDPTSSSSEAESQDVLRRFSPKKRRVLATPPNEEVEEVVATPRRTSTSTSRLHPVTSPTRSSRTEAPESEDDINLEELGVIDTLRKKNKALEKEIVRLKREIENINLQKELEDLKPHSQQLEGGDSAIEMAKLLETVSDLIGAETINEHDECSVCLEEMKPAENCQCLDCGHIFCSQCLLRIGSTHPDGMIVCPSCRKECKPEDILDVNYYEDGRWDELTQFVKSWYTSPTREAMIHEIAELEQEEDGDDASDSDLV